LKSIDTLVQDIYSTVTDPKGFNKRDVAAFSENLVKKLVNRLSERRGGGTLRASNLGKPCSRQLWFHVHRSSDAEPLPAATRLKFLFGDILEEFLLFLARAAGHTVTDEQAEIEVNGVKGHIDGFIDGRLVDCKSASPYAFEKFKQHKVGEDDAFGYIDQLGTYLSGSRNNPNLVDRDVASFLAIDKSQGHIVLDTYPDTGKDYAALADEKRKILEAKEPPERPYKDVPYMKSGNKKLGVACSYCPFKWTCWPNLRKFVYSSGPVYLTEVVRLPTALEVDKNDQRVERDETF
jgi:hypothetical protein